MLNGQLFVTPMIKSVGNIKTRWKLDTLKVTAYISCIGKNQLVAETAKVPVNCFPLALPFTGTDFVPSNSRVFFLKQRIKTFDQSLEQGFLGYHAIW